METLYDELEVTSDADQASIKRAYRSLAQKYHPDKEGGDKDRMQAIQQAYDVLSDPDKRAAYDATGTIPGATRTLRDDSITLITQAVEAAMQNSDVEVNDILQRASALIKNAQHQVGEEKRATQKKLDAVRKAMKRVSAKAGKKNSISPLMLMMEAKLLAPLAGYENGEKAMELALEILADHSCEVSISDKKPENPAFDSQLDAMRFFAKNPYGNSF
jgi:curved DNA-binding protein CbpA